MFFIWKIRLSIRDVTYSLLTKKRTKFTLFDFDFPKTLEMTSRHLENFQKPKFGKAFCLRNEK